jgi:hypothetical protein
MEDKEKEDDLIASLMRAVAQTVCEEMPDVGFVLIMGRSAEDEEYGSLLSLSNLSDEDAVDVLELILARRREIKVQNSMTSDSMN